MAYELTFYLTTPGRPYGETSAPTTTTPGNSGNNIIIAENSPITVLFADDDGELHQIGHDSTPGTLLTDLTIPVGSQTITYPAGTEVALSLPLFFRTGINGERVDGVMQGLLIKQDGEWKPAVIPSPTGNNPGLYIFSKQVPSGEASHDFTMPVGTHSIGSPRAQAGPVNITYNGDPDPGAPPCFTLGTLIDTPDGARPVEVLQAGDLVLTCDHGAQPLIWAGRAELSGAALADAPDLRPIRIAAGALGPGCPVRDLVVSPQHRMLLASRIAQRLTGEAEVLVPACQLVGWPGIEVLPAENGVTYLHLMLAHHEVIRAEGAWSESLYLGPEIRKRHSPMAREIAALFPGLLAADGPLPEPARPFLRGRKLRELTRRAQKNARDLVEALPG